MQLHLTTTFTNTETGACQPFEHTIPLDQLTWASTDNPSYLATLMLRGKRPGTTLTVEETRERVVGRTVYTLVP